MKKACIWLMMGALLSMFCTVVWAAGPSPSLSIIGLVKQPVNLSLEDLWKFQSIEVQFNELFTDKTYQGTFLYRGVPLRVLLETAFIRKEEGGFNKPVDLAIVVKNRAGKQTVLSWGEVFYRNPADVIVGLSARPILPKKDCTRCHAPEVYQPRLDQFHRQIGFPKLIVTSDEWADRSLEDISSIRVVDLRPEEASKKPDGLFSPGFKVTGAVKTQLDITDVSAYAHDTVNTRHLGEGRGYHGVDFMEGASLRSILNQAGIEADVNSAFLISAPDGYRALLSYGEVFLDPSGDRLLVADTMNGKPIETGGRFFFVPPDDLLADRDVKAVEKIEVISVKQDPAVYVIGVGCGDTDLITLEAISHMGMADAFVCPPDIKSQFSKYMGQKPVLADLYEFVPPVMKRKYPDLAPQDLDALMKKEQAAAAVIIQKALDQGKTVAILEYGDPTIWSGWRYICDLFPDDSIRIVPGISSFNASNALINKDVGCNGTIVVATPRGLNENPDMVRAMAQKGETLCIFMGLKDIEDLAAFLKTWYPGQTPACLVFKAGYAVSQSLVMTTIDDMAAAAAKAREKFLGLIYVGPCLSPGPEAS
jgi:precorrin-4 methylase